MLSKFLFCISILSVACSHAADTNTNKPIHAVIIPGLNGLGGENGTQILKMHGIVTHDAHTVQKWADLGQKNCIGHFTKTIGAMQRFATIGGIIIQATSQGSQTAFNYVSQHPEKVRMIIIESMMASGNSAIDWTVGGGSIPGGYYILPYLAKLFAFWSYNPTGIQAIHTVDNIPTHIPIVLTHCKRDPQLAYSDAEAIYARLHAKGNQNVYLIPIDKGYAEHVELIEPNSAHSEVIDAILIKHNLSNKSLKSFVDFKQYQPQPNMAAYNKLITRENRLRTIAPFVKWSICAGILFLGYRFLQKIV